MKVGLKLIFLPLCGCRHRHFHHDSFCGLFARLFLVRLALIIYISYMTGLIGEHFQSNPKSIWTRDRNVDIKNRTLVEMQKLTKKRPKTGRWLAIFWNYSRGFCTDTNFILGKQLGITMHFLSVGDEIWVIQRGPSIFIPSKY